MLVEMSVTNFRSFRETQTLSLVKATSGRRDEQNTFEAEGETNKFQLLQSIAIYGANASGKSNFLKAVDTMRDLVLESATSLNRGDELPVTPFRLSPKYRKVPSEFEIIFIVNGVRYEYGFSATPERIHEEWMFAYPKGRPQRWFHREWSKSGKQYEWVFGKGLVGEKQLWQKSTRDNALFLSTAVQLNSEQLRSIYDWFSDKLKVALASNWSPLFSASIVEKGEHEKIMNFMRSADFDIDNILVKSKSLMEILPYDMPSAVRSEILKDAKDTTVFEIKSIHKGDDGRDVILEFEDESDGTQKIFSLSGPWLDVLKNGYVLCVDELNAHLHPELVKYLVQLFHSKKTNPNGAQLIFSSHETTIMNHKLFRRDQLWFCKKNENQGSELYSLGSFKMREEREKFGPAYLSGRFGAVPFTREMKVFADG